MNRNHQLKLGVAPNRRGMIQVIRVFPIWPDFQSIFQHYTGAGAPYEIRFKDEPQPATGFMAMVEAVKEIRRTSL